MKIEALLQGERASCFVSMTLPPFEFMKYFCSCDKKQRASEVLGRIPAFGADLEMNGSKKQVKDFSTVIYFLI